MSHYRRLLKYGNAEEPLRRRSTEKTLAGKLAEGVPIGLSDTECWEWTKALSTKGYGVLYYKRSPLKAHRVAYEQANGPIPDGQVVRHTCDNPPCVSLSHLVLGTPAENRQDMLDRGRTANGEKNAQARLTTDQVLEIRRAHSDGVSLPSLAEGYGVSYQTVYSIVTRRTWTHI